MIGRADRGAGFHSVFGILSDRSEKGEIAWLFSLKLVSDWWWVGRLYCGRPIISARYIGRLCMAAIGRHP